MNTNRIAVMAALAVSMMTGFSSAARATTLNLVQPNSNRGSWVTINVNGVNEGGFAGALSYSVDGSSSLVDMICVDVTTAAYLNSPYQVVTLPPAAIDNGERAAWLFLNFNSSAQDVVTGTALQLALWDVVHDGGNGLGAGFFQASSSFISNAILAQAESYITASVGHSASAAVIYESANGRSDRQLQIGEAPEPGTIALLASGLVFVGWKARRKKA